MSANGSSRVRSAGKLGKTSVVQRAHRASSCGDAGYILRKWHRASRTIDKCFSSPMLSSSAGGGGGGSVYGRKAPRYRSQSDTQVPLGDDEAAARCEHSAAAAGGAMADVHKKRKQRRFHRIFTNVPGDEHLVCRFSCAYVSHGALIQGHLYVSRHWLGFHSNILGYKTTLAIAFADVLAISKERTAKFFPNAIGVRTVRRKYVFGSMISRDNTFQLLRAFHDRATGAWEGDSCSPAATDATIVPPLTPLRTTGTQVLCECSEESADEADEQLLSKVKSLAMSRSASGEFSRRRAMCYRCRRTRRIKVAAAAHAGARRYSQLQSARNMVSSDNVALAASHRSNVAEAKNKQPLASNNAETLLQDAIARKMGSAQPKWPLYVIALCTAIVCTSCIASLCLSLRATLVAVSLHHKAVTAGDNAPLRRPADMSTGEVVAALEAAVERLRDHVALMGGDETKRRREQLHGVNGQAAEPKLSKGEL